MKTRDRKDDLANMLRRILQRNLSSDNGLQGDVVLEAKTSELARHYERDFGAVRLPVYSSDAPRFMIADDAAKNFFFSYLE